MIWFLRYSVGVLWVEVSSMSENCYADGKNICDSGNSVWDSGNSEGDVGVVNDVKRSWPDSCGGAGGGSPLLEKFFKVPIHPENRSWRRR